MSTGIAPHLRYRALYRLWLAASTTALTILFAIAVSNTRDPSVQRLVPWLTLWIFTVVTPALASRRVHRRCVDLARSGGDGDAGVLRDLAQLRWSLLFQGAMAALAAITLAVWR